MLLPFSQDLQTPQKEILARCGREGGHSFPGQQQGGPGLTSNGRGGGSSMPFSGVSCLT